MIDLYRFLAFIDNLPEVRWVRDQEKNGLKQSVWESDITNKSVRLDTNREEITEYVATQWLTLLGYPEEIKKLVPTPLVEASVNTSSSDTKPEKNTDG